MEAWQARFNDLQLTNMTDNILWIRRRDILVISIFQMEVLLNTLGRQILRTLTSLDLLIFEISNRMSKSTLCSITIDIVRWVDVRIDDARVGLQAIDATAAVFDGLVDVRIHRLVHSEWALVAAALQLLQDI